MMLNSSLRAIALIACVAQFSAYGCMRIGHRGAAGYEPENTLRSLRCAIDLGVDMIEVDVHRCASGELVVIHDKTLGRTTNGLGGVSGFTLQALKKLDAGRGEKIPTLREVFDMVNRRVVINIELKGKYTAVPTARLINEYVYMYGWSPRDFIVSSFDLDELVVFAQQGTGVQLGLLCRRREGKGLFDFYTPDHDRLIGPWLKFLGIDWKDIHDPAEIAFIHNVDLEVYVFTVNDKRMVKVLEQLGVDGIFSDYPDIF